ncbi:ABC transporter substrate-binding protein [Mycolicibacterium sp. HK-90]|uniref:ABC transporter substrate-binding protein n=1 Tax=Mycolicibacterium sp. HK-90 TaxID=3056937 RepID=UPI0026585384|nr:sugar ABC transporter substrate-binding protein [Mycolicibacterium sp. HK-90]WKG05592.1 sugar ABC transporter substrate-binding protein [Mycolicibacterium sp. HK-90]
MAGTRKWLSSVAALLGATTLALAGCSSSGPATESGSGAGDIPADHAGTVKILMEDEHDTEAVESLLDGFKKAYPNINVDIEKLAYDSMRDKLVASFQAPQGTYDLIMIDNPWTDDFVNAGFLAPLDSRVETASKLDYDDFYPALRGVNEIDGSTYGIPMYNYAQGYIYRDDLLQQAGLPVPTTLDELVTTVNKLTTPQHAGIAHSPQRGYKILEEWSSWYAAAGGSMFDKDGNPTIDTPDAHKALQVYIDTLKSASPPNSSNWAQDETIRSLSSGGSASIVGYNWLTSSLNSPESGELAGKFKLAPMPGGRGALGVWSWAIPANSKDSDAAWAFISWITDKDTDKQRVINGGAPTRISTVADPEVRKSGNGESYFAAVDEILKNTVPFAQGPNAEQMVQEVGTQLNEAVIGAKSIDQALADAQAAADQITGR